MSQNDGAAKAREKTEQAKGAVKEAEQGFLRKLRDDGVENPGGLAFFGFGGIFLAAIPLTSWAAQPNGILEKAVNGTGKIAALSALYVTMTYALSGAGSAAATAAAHQEGRDNNYPRAQVKNLTGLPLRLHSAHGHLVEMFPGFAISAALTQAIAPGDQTLINLLGLHVIAKVFVHYPFYILNMGTPSTLSHVFATASIINVALRLSQKPLL